MKYSKHTPGPWTYRKNPIRNDGWFCYESSGKTITFAQVSESDARLIAAAPDLLETLLAIKEHTRRPDNKPSTWNDYLQDLCDKAIKKATGE